VHQTVLGPRAARAVGWLPIWSAADLGAAAAAPILGSGRRRLAPPVTFAPSTA